MGRLSAISLVFVLFIGTQTFAVEGITFEVLQSYLNTDTSLKANTENLLAYLDQVEKKKASFKNDREFLRYLFHKTHQKFLKQYEAYSSFSDLVDRGKYDCLTGTALYSLLLDHVGIEYTIIETNYHIFILAKADGKSILLEATDPLSGFVEDEKEIASTLESYRQGTLQEAQSKDRVQYEFSFNLWEAVSLQELTGLLYFNQAIKSFNNQHLAEAASFLVSANRYRPSERIEEFSTLVIAAIAESELSTPVKRSLIFQLKEVKKQSTQVMSASLSR